jgi:hypothetical protein
MTTTTGATLLVLLMNGGGGAAADCGTRSSLAWLPAGHWSVHVLRSGARLTLPYHDPAAVHRDRHAALAGLFGDVAAMTRLVAEGDVAAVAGAAARRGVVRAGVFGPDSTWVVPAAEADVAEPVARLWLTRTLRCRFGATADVSASPSGVRIEHGTVDAAAGVFRLWAGRRTVGWSPGAGGGLVLNRVESFDGAGAVVSVDEASGAAVAGPWSAELVAGRVDRSGRVAAPWLLGMRVHVRPHARFDVGATRAAVFGGVDGARTGVAEIVRVLAGTNLSADHADDQVASVDARWRPAWSALPPFELYGEWGLHDIDPGVFIDVPAFTVGVRVQAAGSVGAAIEHTQISGACCANPPWYHHFDLANGWTRHGALLGHPLGGQGREWRAALVVEPPTAALVVHVAAALRSRGGENLLAPVRAGRAVIAEARGDARIGGRAAVDVALLFERGSGWSELRARAAARWHP